MLLCIAERGKQLRDVTLAATSSSHVLPNVRWSFAYLKLLQILPFYIQLSLVS